MPQQLTTPLLLVLMVAAFYFLMIRPQQKRARAQRDTLSSLGPGTRVLLANGFYATVVQVHDTAVEVEVAPGVVSHVVKQAVVQVVSPEADPAVAAPVEDELDAVEPAGLSSRTDGDVDGLRAEDRTPDDGDAPRPTGTLGEPTTIADPVADEPRTERGPRSDS